MVRKTLLFIFIIFLSVSLYGYEYLVEPCDDGSFWNIMNGIDPWIGGDFGVTNYTSQGGGAVWLTINTEGDWSNGELRRFGPLRFTSSYATSMADIKSIKMDIYNPTGTNMVFRLYIVTSWDTSRWQYSVPKTAYSNQWTTLEFDLTQENWNTTRGTGDWPDAGSWDDYLHGLENVEEIRLEVFKNDGNNVNFNNQKFILDNILFTVDNNVLNFENYEDKTMNNGSKKAVPAGSSITNYIINNAYQGTQALKIEYNIAANTNATIWLPQLCRNFTNVKWLSFVAKGTGNVRLMLSESVNPPAGISSDGDVWASSMLSISNNDWDTFYISMNSFTKYSGGGAGAKNFAYLTNIGFKVYSGTGSISIDNVKIQTNNYFDKIVGIFPSPGSLFTNAYNKCKVYLESGFDYNNFNININGTDFNKNSSSIEFDTNSQYILIKNLNDFNNYEILKFRLTDNSGLDYKWMYYKKQTYPYEYSVVDNFESYSSDSACYTRHLVRQQRK